MPLRLSQIGDEIPYLDLQIEMRGSQTKRSEASLAVAYAVAKGPRTLFWPGVALNNVTLYNEIAGISHLLRNRRAPAPAMNTRVEKASWSTASLRVNQGALAVIVIADTTMDFLKLKCECS